MNVVKANGLEFRVFTLPTGYVVECEGVLADAETYNEALLYIYTVARAQGREDRF